MNQIKFLILVILSMLSFQAFSENIQNLEANSLVVCKEGAELDAVVRELNATLASPSLMTRSDAGNYYYRIQNYVSSAPTVVYAQPSATRGRTEGLYSVCVTITRK